MTRLAFRTILLASALVACSSTDGTPKRGSIATGTGAVEAGQTVGTNARGNRDASFGGDILDGVVCDWTTEGIAWCDDDYTIAYCSDSTWWLLDCSAYGEYCAEFDDGTVDCNYF
jgi:hypothetical protein